MFLPSLSILSFSACLWFFMAYDVFWLTSYEFNSFSPCKNLLLQSISAQIAESVWFAVVGWTRIAKTSAVVCAWGCSCTIITMGNCPTESPWSTTPFLNNIAMGLIVFFVQGFLGLPPNFLDPELFLLVALDIWQDLNENDAVRWSAALFLIAVIPDVAGGWLLFFASFGVSAVPTCWLVVEGGSTVMLTQKHCHYQHLLLSSYQCLGFFPSRSVIVRIRTALEVFIIFHWWISEQYQIHATLNVMVNFINEFGQQATMFHQLASCSCCITCRPNFFESCSWSKELPC